MRSELLKNNIQFDYFSSNFKQFENDYYRFTKLDIPLTFLTDDILKLMTSTNKDYFLLNKANSVDKKDHYFIFEKYKSENIEKFKYKEHKYDL